MSNKLKTEYDEILKREFLKERGSSPERYFPYSMQYPNYFKKSILVSIAKNMRKDVLYAYLNGSGQELREQANGIPPKFLSIASSSSFCYFSLNINGKSVLKEGADFFSHNGERINKVYFEKKLPILSNCQSTPHIDAYAKTIKREYFFECKCHEIFDYHPIKLSKRYFDSSKDLITKYIPKKYLTIKDKYITINSVVFGVTNFAFDIKQLLTHLMGIACNKKAKKCDLIYFYAFPDMKDIQNNKIIALIEKIKKDAIQIFESQIIKDYCLKNGITIHFYAQYGHIHNSAYKQWTKKIY